MTETNKGIIDTSNNKGVPRNKEVVNSNTLNSIKSLKPCDTTSVSADHNLVGQSKLQVVQFDKRSPKLVKNPINKRKELLKRLLSSGKYKYSRYNGLPLRYAGGKSRAVGHIIEHIPDNVKVLASPFFGGGSIEIACAKELGIKVHGYDIFNILTNYWEVQIKSPKLLAKRIRKFKPTEKCYRNVKNRLKQHWNGEKPITNKVELAAIYWFNHNLSYGPGFLGWMSKIYTNESRVKKMIDKVENFECPKITVNEGTFDKSLLKHKNDFLYCDPPYYLEGDSKMFKGIYPQRNFPVHHNGFDHEKLRDILHNHKEGFVLSYNDCETIRDWYKDFDIHEVQWQYTLGQGETRIGKNRIANNTLDNVKKSHEILIVKK